MKINSLSIFKKSTILILMMMMVVSCVPRERIVYFQGDLESVEKMTGDYTAIIQPDDLLSITVFGRNSEATKIFNQESNVQSSGGGINRPTYLVDAEGYIEFPVLGKVKLAGMNRNEAIYYMKGLLNNEIIDPGVAIKIDNFRITVLGEVSKPGTFSMENEKISLLEAIGLAGDLKITGTRENVLVIREEGEDRNYYRVDLTSDEMFNSPVFYLNQNDVVYVEPNRRARNESSTYMRDTSFIISVTSFMITLITLLSR